MLPQTFIGSTVAAVGEHEWDIRVDFTARTNASFGSPHTRP